MLSYEASYTETNYINISKVAFNLKMRGSSIYGV